MSDFGSVEDRRRTPTKGLRCKLRTFLRSKGIKGKFSTSELRDGTLIVMGITTTLISEFEGHKVVFRMK